MRTSTKKFPSDLLRKYNLEHCKALLLECPEGVVRLDFLAHELDVKRSVEPRGGDINRAKTYVNAMAAGRQLEVTVTLRSKPT